MVLYALVSDTSIGYLFLGGFVPGLLLGVALHDHELDHRAPQELSGRTADPDARNSEHTLRAFPALMLPVVLLFGIYGGVDDADRRCRGRGLLRAVGIGP